MTLLDAPQFDTVRDRRRRWIVYFSTGAFGVLILAWWLVAGLPLDWPWNWNYHWHGTVAVDQFLKAVEKNNLAGAYAIWNHDKDWQKHPEKYAGYPFSRFQQDWGPESQDNDYGAIKSHVIKAARMYGNVLVVAVLINGRKSKALFLDYDTKTRQLGFSPVELYLGP
jgi:hypothetical protein